MTVPTDAEHRDTYDDNRAFLDTGLAATNPRWAAVVAFYAALHLVERLAAAEGLHHSRHVGRGSRHSYLAGHPAHHPLLGDFQALFQASMDSRYGPPTAFFANFPAHRVQPDLIDGCLARIEAYVDAFLAPPVPPAAPPPP